MALFSAVAGLADELAGEPGKLKKRAAIAEAISAVYAAAPQSEDAGLFALYLAGTPFAEADARKLNAGGALLSKALLAVSGANDADVDCGLSEAWGYGGGCVRSTDGSACGC